MTTFRFRGKRLDNGDWIEGDLIHDGSAMRIWEINGEHSEEVIPATVGLISSMPDSTGKLIAQGDKVEGERFGLKRDGIVEFDGITFNIKMKNIIVPLTWYKSEQLTIVGTIHD